MTEENTLNRNGDSLIIYHKMPTDNDDYFFKVFHSTEARKFYKKLKNSLETNYEKVDLKYHERIKHIESCFKSLQHFLYIAFQLSSLINKTNDFDEYTFGNQRPYNHTKNESSGEESYRFADPEIYFGFQTLILEASALLDKLSVNISELDSKYVLVKEFSSERKKVKNTCADVSKSFNLTTHEVDEFINGINNNLFSSRTEKAYYNNLSNRLKNVDDIESKSLLEVYNTCLPILDGILINWKKSTNTIRNILAHNKSISDLGNEQFCVYKWGNEKLYIDYNINDILMIGTTKKVIETVTYCITMMLSVLVNNSYSIEKERNFNYIDYKRYSLGDLEVFWNNNYVNYLDYIYCEEVDDIEDARGFNLVITTDTHHIIEERILRKSIREKIVS